MKHSWGANRAERIYLLTILFLMFVFPIAFIVADATIFHSTMGTVPLVGKWFVFWAVGVRLFTAGLRQAVRPEFTAETILGVKSREPLIIVQELGFANLSIGLLGMIIFFNNNWVFPAAIVGALFYGLAGIRHILSKERNLLEKSAMLSDLIVSTVLIVYLILTLAEGL